MNNTALTEDNNFLQLNIAERKEFIDKLTIAATHGYFGECAEIVNIAEISGLYERIRPISANDKQIKDLDHPIN